MSISFGLWIIRATRNEHKPIHVARLEKLNWFDVNLEQQRPWKIQGVPKIRSSTLQVCSVTYDCTHETNHLCKSCLFLIKYLPYIFCTVFLLGDSIFAFFRQRYACAFIFSCQIFVVFCVLNCSQSFLGFVNIMKDAPC